MEKLVVEYDAGSQHDCYHVTKCIEYSSKDDLEFHLIEKLESLIKEIKENQEYNKPIQEQVDKIRDNLSRTTKVELREKMWKEITELCNKCKKPDNPGNVTSLGTLDLSEFLSKDGYCLPDIYTLEEWFNFNVEPYKE